jgi:hypothetical protein
VHVERVDVLRDAVVRCYDDVDRHGERGASRGFQLHRTIARGR